MSADNYYYVRKNEKGKYDVSHRFASVYYSDEMLEAPMEGYGFSGGQNGWTIQGDSANEGKVFSSLDEAQKAATRRPDWIVPPPKSVGEFDTLQEATMFAHKCVQNDYVVEYGVIIQPDLL
jgi:hypothetical protein